MFRPRIAAATGIALLLAAATLLPATPASAGPLDVACNNPGATTTTFSPALTMTPQNVTVTVSRSYSGCISVSRPDLADATGTSSGTLIGATCTDLLNPMSLTFSLTWTTGEVSVISGTTTVTVVGGVFQTTLIGSVVNGLFAGDNVVETGIAASTEVVQCTLGLASVRRVTALNSLAITSV